MAKLRIVNKTRWQTRDLRRFALAGLKAEGGKWYHYTVEFRTQKGSRTGLGAYQRTWIAIMLPTPDQYLANQLIIRNGDIKDGKEPHPLTPDRLNDAYVRYLAEVLAHEVAHNRNLRHREIDDSQRDLQWVEDLITSGFVIRKQPEKPKRQRDLRAERQAHAQKMLAQHEAKAKREQKLVRKWRQKVRYYERAMAARQAEN